MRNFVLGFMIAGAMGMTGLMVQKVTHEREKVEIMHREGERNWVLAKEIAGMNRVSRGKAQVWVTRGKR